MQIQESSWSTVYILLTLGAKYYFYCAKKKISTPPPKSKTYFIVD